jgi:1-acyl-sn-glycerol-3-phosphate acyltransferase
VADWITRLAGLLPESAGGIAALRAELDDRVARIPVELNEYGFDPWGFNPEAFKNLILPSAILYRYWFRCRTIGLERLPQGRLLLIGNHAGQVAFDGMMITTALLLEAEPPRLGRAMGEYWLGALPWLSIMMERSGSAVGTRKTCVDMLNKDECTLAFPEGVRGMNKVYADAYKLMPFGLGFMRLALETNTPIIPVSVVGSEEQNPGIANFESLGRMLGMPAFPITLTFPWLGPFGMLPLPVRYHIEFGEPLYFEGDPHDDDDVIQAKVDVVRAAISKQLDEGRERRESIFL